MGSPLGTARQDKVVVNALYTVELGPCCLAIFITEGNNSS